MDVALLLLPLIGGFIFSKTWFGTRYACAREEGHRLYFRAGFVAVFLFALAALLRFLLNEVPFYESFENWLAGVVKDTAKQTDFGSLFALTMVCVYAMLLAWPLAFILNKIND